MSAHILLIDDDQIWRTSLREKLGIQGYRVSEADIRASALEKLHTDPTISVVILDPGLSPCTHNISEGMAILQVIRTELFKVKVIVCTGLYKENAALEVIREGAFDFLSKPAAPQAILDAAARALLFLQKERELEDEGIMRISINAQVGDGLKSVRTETEKYLVQHVLRETGFNVYKSAIRLGIKRENMYYFLKKYRITRDKPE